MSVSDTVERTLADLRKSERNYVAAILGSDRLDDLGAGNYYLHRLQNNKLLPEAEWEVLKFVLQMYPEAHIVEIGCGWGQMLAMAAAVGYSCAGVDYSLDRLAGANFLRELVDVEFPGAGARLHYLRGSFPSDWDTALALPAGREGMPLIGFFSNLGLGRPADFVEQCVMECRRFDYVIMDVFRFFGVFPDADSQNSLIENMRRLGVSHVSDIHSSTGHRFVALSVEAKTAAPRSIGRDTRDERILIDLFATRIVPVRSTIKVIDEGRRSSFIRTTEDHTAGDSHDIRLVHPGKPEAGLYSLVVGLRARDRTSVCLLLHCRWQNQVRLIFNAVNGLSSIEDTVGETFTVDKLKTEASSEWAYLRAVIRIAHEPEEVAISVHLVDDAGRYHYNGDGMSAIDICALSLTRL